MQASRPISFAYPDLEPEPEPEAFFSVSIPPTPSPRPSLSGRAREAPSAAGIRPLPSMASPAAVGMRPQPPLPSSALGSFGGGFGAEPEPEPEPDAGDLASRLASMSPASRRLEEMEAQHPALELERVSTRLEELRQEGRDVQKHVDHLRREIEAATAELEKQRGAKQEMARKLELAEDESQAEYLHNASIFEENAKMQQELHELQEKTAAARAEEEEDLAKTAELEARLAVEEGETEALLKQVKELEASALEAERLVEQRTREKEAEKEAEKKLMAELEQLKPDGDTPGADPGLLQQVQALEAQNATLMAELSDLQARGAQQQAMLSSVEEMSAEARQQRDTNAALARELDLLQRQNARRQQVCRALLPAAALPHSAVPQPRGDSDDSDDDSDSDSDSDSGWARDPTGPPASPARPQPQHSPQRSPMHQGMGSAAGTPLRAPPRPTGRVTEL